MSEFKEEEEQVIKEVLQKAYLRWEGIRKAKRLVDSEWLKEKANKLPNDQSIIYAIEGLLAGNPFNSIAKDAHATPMGLFQWLKDCGIEVDEKLCCDD